MTRIGMGGAVAMVWLAWGAAVPVRAQQDHGAQPDPAAGPIAKADFQAAARARMLKADSNGDGKVSAAEWTAAEQARSGGEGAGGGRGGFGERMFARLDANQDGFVDTAEIDAVSAQRFDRQDANGDGILTPEERQAARDRMMGARGDHGPQ